MPQAQSLRLIPGWACQHGEQWAVPRAHRDLAEGSWPGPGAFHRQEPGLRHSGCLARVCLSFSPCWLLTLLLLPLKLFVS